MWYDVLNLVLSLSLGIIMFLVYVLKNLISLRLDVVTKKSVQHGTPICHIDSRTDKHKPKLISLIPKAGRPLTMT